MLKKIILTLMISTITLLAFAEGMKFAVINTDKILEQSKDGKRIQGILEALQEEWNNQISEKETEYQTAYDAYLNPPPMASDDFKKQKQDELTILEGEYVELQKEISKKANKKQSELLQPLFVKLEAITDNLAKKNGYSAIFDVTLTGFVYVDSTLDVTDIVIEEMNKNCE